LRANCTHAPVVDLGVPPCRRHGSRETKVPNWRLSIADVAEVVYLPSLLSKISCGERRLMWHVQTLNELACWI
jgi:hypothetical protein